MKLWGRMINIDKASQITNEFEPVSTQEPAVQINTPGKLGKKSVFGNINSDLKSALDTWEHLTEKMTTKVSPEELQLTEVKRLLQDLKSKLNEFGE